MSLLSLSMSLLRKLLLVACAAPLAAIAQTAVPPSQITSLVDGMYPHWTRFTRIFTPILNSAFRKHVRLPSWLLRCVASASR